MSRVEQPRISVVTAVYNAESTICDAISSTLNQQYPNVELIVVDGASTDGTLARIAPLRDAISVLCSEPDEGIYYALNKGISLASGDIVGFLHADDVFENADALSLIAAAFADPSVDAVYADLVYVKSTDTRHVVRYWRSGSFDRNRLRYGWMPPHPTFYVRRSWYQENGGFDTSYRIASDYECMLRLLTRSNLRVSYIPHVLVRMRTGGISNRSLKTVLLKSWEDLQVLRTHRIGGLSTLIRKNLRKVSQLWLKPNDTSSKM